MNEATNEGTSATEQWAAFQRIWTETFSKMMQAGLTVPESAPPEFVRQLRAGIFQALGQSWDQFLRSPQFLDGMKQWMDQAIAFRQMSNEFLTRARHEQQAPARDDVDHVLKAIAHLENRILARIEELASQVKALEQRLDVAEARSPAGTVPRRTTATRRKASP